MSGPTGLIWTMNAVWGDSGSERRKGGNRCTKLAWGGWGFAAGILPDGKLSPKKLLPPCWTSWAPQLLYFPLKKITPIKSGGPPPRRHWYAAVAPAVHPLSRYQNEWMEGEWRINDPDSFHVSTSLLQTVWNSWDACRCWGTWEERRFLIQTLVLLPPSSCKLNQQHW